MDISQKLIDVLEDWAAIGAFQGPKKQPLAAQCPQARRGRP
jgi:hypothetical protein